MARRRGNKKVRDRERDSTPVRRIAKVGLTAAGIITGGSLFLKSDIGKKTINSGLLGAAFKTSKNFKNDLLNKPKNLRTLKSAFDKNIGKNGELFREEMRRQKDKKIKLGDAKLTRKLHTIKQSKDLLLKAGVANEKQKAKSEFTLQQLKKLENSSDDFKNQIKDFIDSTYDKVNKNNAQDNTMQEYLKKHIKNMSKGRDEQTIESTLKDMLVKMAEYKEINAMSNDAVLKKYGKAAEEATRYQMNKLGSKDKSFVGKINELFNTDIGLKLTGTRAATIEDLSRLGKLDDVDFSSKRLRHFIREEGMKSLNETIDYNEQIRQLLNDDKYKKLIIDSSLRIGTDEDGKEVLQSFGETFEFLNNIKTKFDETVPGKILLKSIDTGKKESFGALISEKKDLNAHLVNGENNILKDMMVYMDGTLFGTKEIGGEVHIDYDTRQESKVVTGWRKKIAHDILGTNKHPGEAYQSDISKILDFNQDGKFNFKEEMKRWLNKTTDPTWERNALKRTREFYTDNDDLQIRLNNVKKEFKEFNDGDNKEALVKNRLHNSNYITSIIMNKQITGVSDELIDSVIEKGNLSDKEKHLMELLLSGAENDVSQFFYDILDNGSGGLVDIKKFENFRLADIVNLSLQNSERAKDVSHVSLKEGNVIPLFDMAIDEKYQRDVVGQLRVEMLKEIMLGKDKNLRKVESNDNFIDWINSLDVDKSKSNELENIGLLGIFEKFNNIKQGKYVDNISESFQIGGSEESLHNIINKDGRLKNLFEQKMVGMEESFNIMTRGYTGGLNETDMYDEYNNLTVVKQSNFSGLKIIESINSAIKGDYDTLKDNLFNGIKELNGGRKRPEDVSTLTLGLQYSISRINYGLQEIGLHLSEQSMGSPLETYLNFGLKRVLPIMAAGKTLEYLNDESRRFLGSSITEAGARSLSYVDVGSRKIAYNLGIGNKLNSFAESSVIHEYMFGSNHFNTAEEQQQWYEDGYSPVRKGRFWSFGSASEFRGGSISYWQPNYLRRAESNYHDISVYGSSEEKWAHSWIPTPTHPLSTIRAAINPYWLEKKHLKEGDRPYPLTAKMFSEGTPWGAVLNPTVGEILKPVRMLPEVKLRLGKDGRDSRAVIEQINDRIKSKKRQNDDLLIVNGTDVRTGEYVPYGNPENNELNLSIKNGNVVSDGVGYMNNIRGIENYQTPNGADYVEGYGTGTNRIIGVGSTNSKGVITYSKEQKFINNIKQGLVNHDSEDGIVGGIAQSTIASINSFIKYKKNRFSKASGPRNTLDINSMPDKSNSTYIYTNKINDYNNYMKNYYEERLSPSIIDKSVMSDYHKDMIRSTKQIAGMYGFLSDLALDSNNTYTFRYENAGQMSSFTRSFWDSNIGGLGGGTMEIARRFFPSVDRKRVNVNPLLNNMPEWIPDSYHTGDPYTNIPKGEMRLPGKGYETINQLHPDRFGDYGAFDRFKILADIAPNSTEYKKWKNIAQNTITDNTLLEEMKKITERTAKMSGNHEFFEYKYMRNNTPYQKGIVKSVDNGMVTLADNTKLSLAGLTVTNNTNSGLYENLTAGEEIVYRTNRTKVMDKDEYGNIKDSRSYAAVIYHPGQSMSINRTLLDQGYAEKNVEDKSALGQIGKLSPAQETMGAVQEFFAHAPIPIIHNKFLKVESSYESYMNETYYGASFQTWDHPYKAFIKPMINKQSGKSLVNEALSLGIAYNHFANVLGKTDSKATKWISNIALSTANPTAFLGGNIAYALHLSNGAIGKGQEMTRWQKGAKLGVTLGTAKYAWDNADNPFKSIATMAAGGFALGTSDFGWEVTEKFLGKMTGSKGALIGAGVGLAMSAIKNPNFNKEKIFGKWTPKETKKKWELDEYFDRLEYIKYESLYKAAAKRAAFHEKTDIKGIFKQIDKNKNKINKLNIKEQKLMDKQKNGHDKYSKEIEEIEQQKMMLEEQSKLFYKGGKYTQAAVAYKKKAESTMYGLDSTATKDELLAAVPSQYKDHFSAFFDITDKKEQKKILKSVSPIMRRPLQAAWNVKLDKPQSNSSFFKIHAMPGVGWRGWKPNVNLKHVKMKTIQNEGMILSDFGYYDSEKSSAQYELSPDINNYDQGNGLMSMIAMKRKLRGAGLKLSNISVDRTSAPGMRVVGDIKESVSNTKKVTSYGVSKLAYDLGSSLF